MGLTAGHEMSLFVAHTMSHPIGAREVHSFVEKLFEPDLHVKRVLSLADATLGAITAASAAIHAIGAGLAVSKNLRAKHAVKQVDRLLSNTAISVWALFARWVPYVVAARKEVVVALDWTEFDGDDHSTIALNMVTSHGRASPLMWMTVRKSNLAGNRNDFEDQLLKRFREVIPEGVKVTVLADRGFGDQKLYQVMADLRFDYVIRFREGITVTKGEDSRSAKDWVPSANRALMLKGAAVTQDRFEVPAVVCVQDAGMKDAWCLATSRDDLRARQVVRLYGKRFTIEETFRDTKDIHFGMGLSATHIKSIDRRDRLLLICALATVLITLLGAAGESLGMDRWLKVNTVKRRTHSLFRQGQHYYAAMLTMKQSELTALINRFGEMLRGHPLFSEALGFI
jgi:hypothetical protein